ncbi:MAG: precorrin-4 C(11)-methyltransferase [Desulfovibrio sp.]
MDTKVYFIGAGPGDPELITVKGQRLIREADLVLYAGSLVPAAIVEQAKSDATVQDSSGMTLEAMVEAMAATVEKGGRVARVHTGDPSIYGAIREQAALLEERGITTGTIPGVTSAMACAAAAQRSFTVPEQTQTLIITRMAGRTPVPEKESLEKLASHNSAMAIYLSATLVDDMQEKLRTGGYAEDTTIAIGYRVGWPEEKIFQTTLKGLVDTVRENELTRQTMFLILPGQHASLEETRSLLYAGHFSHGYRNKSE